MRRKKSKTVSTAFRAENKTVKTVSITIALDRT
jgi:hypothetical protein